MRSLGICLLAAAILITACGDDSPKVGLEAASENNAPSAEDEISSASGQSTLPLNEMILHTDLMPPGMIGFVHNNNLYRVGFDGEVAVPVVEDLPQIFISLNDRHFLLQYPGTSTVQIVDLIAGTQAPLFSLNANQTFQVINSSPDGQWFTIGIIDTALTNTVLYNWLSNAQDTVIEQRLFHVSGEELHLPDLPFETDPDLILTMNYLRLPVWLADNRLLLLSHNAIPAEGALRETVAEMVTPGTSQIETVNRPGIDFGRLFYSLRSLMYEENVDLTSINRTISYAVDELGWNLAVPIERLQVTEVLHPQRDYALVLDRGNGTNDLCSRFSLTLRPVEAVFVPETIFTEGAAFVSDIVVDFETSTASLMRVLAPNCDRNLIFQQILQVSLQEPYDVSILYETDHVGDEVIEPMMAISPDERYMLWTHHSAINHQDIVYLTALDEGTTEAVIAFDAEADAPPAVSELYWIDSAGQETVSNAPNIVVESS